MSDETARRMALGADISRRVDALEARLRERGESQWADTVRDAVAGGATGTEILVRVDGVLAELEKTGIVERAELRALRSSIGKALKV